MDCKWRDFHVKKQSRVNLDKLDAYCSTAHKSPQVKIDIRKFRLGVVKRGRPSQAALCFIPRFCSPSPLDFTPFSILISLLSCSPPLSVLVLTMFQSRHLTAIARRRSLPSRWRSPILPLPSCHIQAEMLFQNCMLASSLGEFHTCSLFCRE